MPTVSEATLHYLPRRLPNENANTVPTSRSGSPAEQLHADLEQIESVPSTSNAAISTPIKLAIGIGIGLCVITAIVVPIVITQIHRNSNTTTTNTTTTTTTTTTSRNFRTITLPGDPLVGICSTVAGGSSTSSTSGSSPCQYPAAENPPNAIDNNTNTKYLNVGANTDGYNTGFYVTPTVGASTATGIQFATANDASVRDPITITLEGSNSISSQLSLGSSWTLIYNGPTGISPTVDPGRLTYTDQQNFTNAVSFTSYRLLVTGTRQTSNGCCMQFSEVNIIGYV